MQLNRKDISCHIVQINKTHPYYAFGYVADIELCRFVGWNTGGSFLTFPDDFGL